MQNPPGREELVVAENRIFISQVIATAHNFHGPQASTSKPNFRMIHAEDEGFSQLFHGLEEGIDFWMLCLPCRHLLTDQIQPNATVGVLQQGVDVTEQPLVLPSVEVHAAPFVNEQGR